MGDALLITWPRQGGVCARRGRDARVVRRQMRIRVREVDVHDGEEARRGSAEGVRGAGEVDEQRGRKSRTRRTRADE